MIVRVSPSGATLPLPRELSGILRSCEYPASAYRHSSPYSKQLMVSEIEIQELRGVRPVPMDVSSSHGTHSFLQYVINHDFMRICHVPGTVWDAGNAAIGETIMVITLLVKGQ